MDLLLAGDDIVVIITDLLSLIVEDLAAEKLVFKWTWNNCIEIEVAVHIGRDQTVVALEELADLDLGETTFGNRAQRSLLFLILVILNVDITII